MYNSGERLNSTGKYFKSYSYKNEWTTSVAAAGKDPHNTFSGQFPLITKL